MDYRPGLPEKNHNVSHDNPLSEFFTLLAGLAAAIVAVYWVLGLAVDRAVESISTETEIRLLEATGIDWSSAWESSGSGDAEVESELGELLTALNQCAQVEYPVVLALDSADTVNAFALPGGQIVIMQGLLDQLETENGVAFVLAHELAHFKNRDHLRGMGRSVVLLAMAVLATGPNSDLAQLLTPVNQLQTAQFSQDRESSADATALDILNCHYGHVGGATEFFDTIGDRETDFDYSLSHYFSSHPENRRRIEAIRILRKSRNYSVGQLRKPPWLD